MGCDGGTKATKRSLVVKKRKEERNQRDKFAESEVYWTLCHYSRVPFTKSSNVVCDELGFLFDKQSILEALFEKKFRSKPYKSDFGYITQMSDLQDVNFTNSENSGSKNLYICPFSLKGVGGPYKFVCFRPCGHVISKSSFDDIFKRQNPSERTCCVCNKIIESYVVLNNDSSSIVAKKRELFKKKKEKRKNIKRKKKKRKREEDVEIIRSEISNIEPPRKKLKVDGEIPVETKKIPDSMRNKLFFKEGKNYDDEFLVRGYTRF